MFHRLPLIAVVVAALCSLHARADDAKPKPRFPSLGSTEVWNRIPRDTPSLPGWARVLSKPLPVSTSALLHLDHLHRTKNPLDPVLRGKLRWVAAKSNRCEYSMRYAEADLRRAGATDADLKRLAGSWEEFPADERVALSFARQMTLKASDVTDEDFAKLVEHYGAETVVAMVHTLAFANFQDRLVLALGIKVEPDGPYPPVDVEFNPRARPPVKAPKRPKWKSVLNAKVELAKAQARPQWKQSSIKDVQSQLTKQKTRKSRIPPPDWKEVAKRLPKSQRRRGPSKIEWSRISMGYQPQLTQAWFGCMQAFGREGDLDRVFANSMFWIITRSNECFY